MKQKNKTALTRTAVLTAVLVAGLVVGVASSGGMDAARDRAARSSSATGSTRTATVVGQPGVTAVQTPTVPADQLPGYGKPIVKLGDMNTPEQFIIGQLYLLALKQQGYIVSLSRNVGTSQVAQNALQQGSLDIYPAYLAEPDYLSEWNVQVTNHDPHFATEAAAYAAAERYASRKGLVLLAPTPFSDTGGIAVTSQYASQNRINSISGLAHGTRAILAAPLEFETDPDGLPAVARAYHFDLAYVQAIDLGYQFAWLRTGNVQAVYANTTDPQLTGREYKLLGDPKHVFGFGNVVPVTTRRVLNAEGPAFARTIERVDAVLTTSAMRGLNAEMQLSGHGPTAVAEQFLQGHGILTPIQYAPIRTGTQTTTGATS